LKKKIIACNIISNNQSRRDSFGISIFMKFNIITIFPNIINSYCSETILSRAQKNKLIKINAINLRDFTDDNHKTVALRQAQGNFEPRRKVDDTPYGGGPGMVMKAEPIYKALKSVDAIPFSKDVGVNKVLKVINLLRSKIENRGSSKKRTILLSPRGKQFDQRMAEKFSKLNEITFVCGRYEGVDQRVVDHMVDEEISVGPYVLAGGELGSLIIVEAVSRLLPGVLGNEESLKEETFNTLAPEHLSTRASKQPSTEKSCSAQVLECSSAGVGKEYPQYTKPADFRGWKVPEVLLSGDHKKIEEWRRSN
jgi:tRNA (guanine37-N1)-methyltransferase